MADIAADVADLLAGDLQRPGWTAATAESVSAGRIAAVLASAQSASDWF